MYLRIWSFFVPKYVPAFDTKYVTDYKRLGITSLKMYGGLQLRDTSQKDLFTVY